jgi:hypothetical protein
MYLDGLDVVTDMELLPFMHKSVHKLCQQAILRSGSRHGPTARACYFHELQSLNSSVLRGLSVLHDIGAA